MQLQFQLGILKCFTTNGILQGTFEIKNGRTIDETMVTKFGLSPKSCPGYLHGSYNAADYNLVYSLAMSKELQIWTLTIREMIYEVSGSISKYGKKCSDPKIEFILNGKLNLKK